MTGDKPGVWFAARCPSAYTSLSLEASSSSDVCDASDKSQAPWPIGPWALGLWLCPEGLHGRLATGRIFSEQRLGCRGGGKAVSGAGGLCLASPLPSPLSISNVGCMMVGRLHSEKLRISPSKTGWESGQHRVLASKGGLAWASRWRARVPRRDACWVLLGPGREVLTACCIHCARPPRNRASDPSLTPGGVLPPFFRKRLGKGAHQLANGSRGQAQSFLHTLQVSISDQKVLRAHLARMFPVREAWPRPGA